LPHSWRDQTGDLILEPISALELDNLYSDLLHTLTSVWVT